MIKYILIFFVIGIVILLWYDRLATIRFANNRAHVAPLYCKLFVRGERMRGPVIFIPGTKGSTLAVGGSTLWLRVRDLLGGGAPFVYNGLGADPTGLLTRLAIVPGIFEYKPYQKIVARLACGEGAYFYSYDWRRSPIDNAVGLGTLVDRVQNETGQKPSIIAHSMGGLITHYYMKSNADKINRLVYVGVPFQPGVSFLEDIDKGSPVGLNKTILSREALFSHPGSFALLPHTGSTAYKNADLMNPGTWKENKLSVYAAGGESDDVLGQNLSQARRLFTDLDSSMRMNNEFLFIIGNCQDILAAIGADGINAFKPGDTRVVAEGALPVEQAELRKTIMYSCAKHDALLSDIKVLESIQTFLQ